MRFSVSLFSIGFGVSIGFATAVPSNTGLIQERDEDCTDGPGWARPVHRIGGSGGTFHCETSYGHDYSPVSGIEVWRKGNKHGDRISGIKFTYASGVSSQIYGQEDTSKYPSDILNLDPGELITDTILYGNGKGEWLGHIHIETAKPQTFDAGRDTKNIDPWGINVGGGLLYGAHIVTSPDGDNGESIQSLALLFLAEPVDRIAITDVKYDTPPQGTSKGITPQNVVVGTWYNDADSNVGYSLAPTYTVTESYTISQQSTRSFSNSLDIEVSAEIFDIGSKVSDGFTWGVSSEKATTTGTTSATAVACVATGTLAPHKGVRVTGTYQTGKGSFDYESTVTIYLKDGSNFSYQEKGTLTNVAYNQCSTRWTEQDDPNIQNSPGLKALPKMADPTITSSAALGPAPTSNVTVSGARRLRRALHAV